MFGKFLSLSAAVVFFFGETCWAAGSKVEVAYQSERYSRLGPGYSWRAEAAAPVQRVLSRAVPPIRKKYFRPVRNGWSVLGAVETLRRFQNNDRSGAVGVAWKGEGRGGYARVGFSPGADVVPIWSLEGVWDQSFFRGLYAEALARVSEYTPAHTFTQSLGLYYYPFVWAELGARASATTTRFHGAGSPTRWGYLLSGNLYARGETLRLTPSFGRYEEPFEAGAGAIRSFAASVYHLGLGWKLVEKWGLKLDGEYEDRSDSSFVRRGGAAVTRQF